MPRRKSPGGRATARPDIHFPVAYVKYFDHCWLQSKEMHEIEAAEPYVVEETGFLLKETPDYITIAKERSTDGEKGKTTFDDVTILMRSDIIDLQIFPLLANGTRKNGTRRTSNGARAKKATAARKKTKK